MPRPHPRKSDPRRLAAMWLLKSQGATLAEIAAAFEISSARVSQLVKRVERDIEAAARREIRRPTMAATQRLAAAGALSSPARPPRDPLERIRPPLPQPLRSFARPPTPGCPSCRLHRIRFVAEVYLPRFTMCPGDQWDLPESFIAPDGRALIGGGYAPPEAFVVIERDAGRVPHVGAPCPGDWLEPRAP